MYHDFFLHIAHNGERMNSVIAWDIFLLFKKNIFLAPNWRFMVTKL